MCKKQQILISGSRHHSVTSEFYLRPHLWYLQTPHNTVMRASFSKKKSYILFCSVVLMKSSACIPTNNSFSGFTILYWQTKFKQEKKNKSAHPWTISSTADVVIHSYKLKHTITQTSSVDNSTRCICVVYTIIDDLFFWNGGISSGHLF